MILFVKKIRYLFIGLLVSFLIIWGCRQDEYISPISPDTEEMLMHWAGTHNPQWNVLLIEKIARYEPEDSLVSAYARDLEILLYAERYYYNELVKIYGAQRMADSVFLKQEWERLIDKVIVDSIKPLNYNEEWNLYRQLYYQTPAAQRSLPQTRSDEIVIWGCDFRQTIFAALRQLGTASSDNDKIANNMFRGEPMFLLFTPPCVNLCERHYTTILDRIRDMKRNSGSDFSHAYCRTLQEMLSNDLREFVKCVNGVMTELRDQPMPPGTYYPPYPIIHTESPQGPTYNDIIIDCSDESLMNGESVSSMYRDFLSAGVKEVLYAQWEASNKNVEWGHFLVNNKNKLQLGPRIEGNAADCPLNKPPKNALATVHTHPLGNPPSDQDLFHLSENCITSNYVIRNSYIYTTDNIYNLYITDIARASLFYEMYSSASGKTELRELILKYANALNKQRQEAGGEYKQNELHIFAIAAALKTIDAGIVITELFNAGFGQYDAKVKQEEKDDKEIIHIIKKLCNPFNQ